jgi:hypothetical protein
VDASNVEWDVSIMQKKKRERERERVSESESEAGALVSLPFRAM